MDAAEIDFFGDLRQFDFQINGTDIKLDASGKLVTSGQKISKN